MTGLAKPAKWTLRPNQKNESHDERTGIYGVNISEIDSVLSS